LKNRGIRKFRIDLLDPEIRAIIPPPIDPNRSVYTMNHPAIYIVPLSQPIKIEIERIKQTGPGSMGKCIIFYPKSTTFKLGP
jgi:hypothetical protein